MTDYERPSARFSVDTHLFRELGELLVGRESTALIELVKNAYDADASEVIVYGEKLDDPNQGLIRLTDNGVGMDPETFQRGFLRVASRIKTEGTRKSERFGRRFTGAKGVGRLAAHKLAGRLEVQSTPWAKREGATGVDGVIDWDRVEEAETLDLIGDDAVVVTDRPMQKPGAHHGTTITLRRLRRKWTDRQRVNFLAEVEALRVPKILISVLPKSVIHEAGLFESPTYVDMNSDGPGFEVKLEGDFQVGTNYWVPMLGAADWLLEIDAAPSGVRYLVAPTVRRLAEKSHAQRMTFSEHHPAPTTGPFFHARILIREGGPKQGTSKEERAWASRFSGIRVYMEGFRVLPYGEDSDDWLMLSRDNSDRSRKLRFLANSTAPGTLAEHDDEGLFLLPSKHYFGCVFLTADRSNSLQPLVNREGFVPNASFSYMVELVRRGIDLSTRVRVATHVATKAPTVSSFPAGDSIGSAGSSSSGQKETLNAKTEGTFRRLEEQTKTLKRLAEAAPPNLREQLLGSAHEIGRAMEASRELIPATSMILVLASVGTQLSAFNHEVHRLLGMASDLETIIATMRRQDIPPKLRNLVSKVASAAVDLRRALERQAAYLVDIVTPDGRRKRSRLEVVDTLNAAWKFVATAAEQREIEFRNETTPNLRTPPMFRAELLAVFSNLLTNAVKAAGIRGVIRARGHMTKSGILRFRIENTGVPVDPREGERWFRPFESTTLDVDPILGQGMGMGLVITRDLLSEVGADISFVDPDPGFAAAVEIVFPGASS